jgi:adenylate cyclase
MARRLPFPATGSLRAIAAALVGPKTARRLRLACGLIMFTYVTLHLLNHSLGIFGWQAMQLGGFYAALVWRSLPGTLFLYGAFMIHYLLALWDLYQRRSFRMGWSEGSRLLLGFSILPLLIHHYVAQRYIYSVYDVHRSYDEILYVEFYLVPLLGARQALLLLVAWTHGCMGLHYWLRLTSFYRRFAPLVMGAAVLLPALALLGVAQGARQIAILAQADPDWLETLAGSAHLNNLPIADGQWQVEIWLYLVYGDAILVVFTARALRACVEHRRRWIAIAHPDARSMPMDQIYDAIPCTSGGEIPEREDRIPERPGAQGSALHS